jgi:hypothetical protein
MRWWHSLNCTVQNQDAEAAEMTARLKRLPSNRLRHSLGNGIPGPQNWSARDELTIQTEPLGAPPEAVNWSVSIVLTPGGFVGRIDNYVKGITQHLEVEPNTARFFEEIEQLSPGSSRQSWQAQYSGTPTRKSRSSRNFPARETPCQKKNHPTLPKTKAGSTETKPKRGGKKAKTLIAVLAAWFMKHSGPFARITTRRLQPLPISAKSTASIGIGNIVSITAVNPGSGGSR